MSVMQRRKGQVGECELARLLSDLLGVHIRRRVRQRDGDSDLEGLTGWCIECKRAKTAKLGAWWSQTLAQALAREEWPVLFYRIDRKEWRAVWPVSAALVPQMWPIAESLGLNYTAESSLDAWASVYRETLIGGELEAKQCPD